MAAHPSRNASRLGVTVYLQSHYGVTDDDAIAAVAKHKGIVDTAIADLSFNYWPGDKIADAEGWAELPEEEWDDDDAD